MFEGTLWPLLVNSSRSTIMLMQAEPIGWTRASWRANTNPLTPRKSCFVRTSETARLVSSISPPQTRSSSTTWGTVNRLELPHRKIPVQHEHLLRSETSFRRYGGGGFVHCWWFESSEMKENTFVLTFWMNSSFEALWSCLPHWVKYICTDYRGADSGGRSNPCLRIRRIMCCWRLASPSNNHQEGNREKCTYKMRTKTHRCLWSLSVAVCHDLWMKVRGLNALSFIVSHSNCAFFISCSEYLTRVHSKPV